MKKQWFPLFTVIALLGAVACNSNNTNSDANADSTSVSSEKTSAGDNNAAVGEMKTGSYVDLGSGKDVELNVDTRSRAAKPVDESIVVTYYVDPSNNDTIEASSGRIVNGALLHVNGNWSVDESKIKYDEDGSYKEKSGDTKFKVDDDGDVKYKDGDNKMKYDADDDKYKEKTPDGKVKVKDGKTKIKKDD